MTESGFTDLDKICRDCGAVFVLTAGEQAFFAGKALNMPTRCAKCRAVQRAKRATSQAPRYEANRAQPPFRTW